MAKDTRIFRASEVEGERSGWIVDLSPANAVNSDCYWPFPSRGQAQLFAALHDAGMDNREAEALASRLPASVAAQVVRRAAMAELGSARSERKTAANRAKANLPPKPGKRPRGRPRKDSSE